MADACPRCHSLAPLPRKLNVASTNGATYYRCDACGHVWIVLADDPTSKPIPVTFFKDDQKKR